MACWSEDSTHGGPSTGGRATPSWEVPEWGSVARRTVDVVVGALLLVSLVPSLMILAACVRLGMGRPILFRQTRSGLRGRPFELVKFRTMRLGPEGDPLTDEARITRLGAFLRRFSLDELPELLNVVKGDMSLVGPRPLLPEYLDRYSTHQARRLEVKPGITGLAQVSGRNALTWDERLDLDVWYVDHRSVGLDLRILATTLWHAITGRGVSAPGHATMPEFKG